MKSLLDVLKVKVLVWLIIICIIGVGVLFFIGKSTEAIVLLVGSIITIALAYPQYRTTKESRTPVVTLGLKMAEEDFPNVELAFQNQCNQIVQVQLDYKSSMGSIHFAHDTIQPINIEPFNIHKKILFEKSVMEDILSHLFKLIMPQFLGNPDANAPLRLYITANYTGLQTGLKGAPIFRNYRYDATSEKFLEESMVCKP